MTKKRTKGKKRTNRMKMIQLIIKITKRRPMKNSKKRKQKKPRIKRGTSIIRTKLLRRKKTTINNSLITLRLVHTKIKEEEALVEEVEVDEEMEVAEVTIKEENTIIREVNTNISERLVPMKKTTTKVALVMDSTSKKASEKEEVDTKEAEVIEAATEEIEATTEEEEVDKKGIPKIHSEPSKKPCF